MPFPFRNPVEEESGGSEDSSPIESSSSPSDSSGDSWSPPSYAVLKKDSSAKPKSAKSGKTWSPPEYATLKTAPKPQPGLLSRIINPPPHNYVGDKTVTAFGTKDESIRPLMYGEQEDPNPRIARANRLVDPDAPKTTEPLLDTLRSRDPKYAGALSSSPVAQENPNKGYYEKISDAISQAAKDHPKIRRFVQDFLTGSSPESQAETKAFAMRHGMTEKEAEYTSDPAHTQGPGMMTIPGMDKLTDYISQKIVGSGDGSHPNLRLAAGAVTKAIGDTLASGFDPRTAGLNSAEGLTARESTILGMRNKIGKSREVPYRFDPKEGVVVGEPITNTNRQLDLNQKQITGDILKPQPKPKPAPAETTKAQKVNDYIKQNPDAKMADIEKFVNDVTGSTKPSTVESIKDAIKTARPTKSKDPNLNQGEGDPELAGSEPPPRKVEPEIEPTEPPKPDIKTALTGDLKSRLDSALSRKEPPEVEPSKTEPPIKQTEKAVTKKQPFVNPFEKKSETIPDRSPNLSAEFQPPSVAAKAAPIKSAEDVKFDLARNKFNMGQDMPDSARTSSVHPTEPDLPVRQPASAKYAFDWPEVGRQYDIHDPDNTTGVEGKPGLHGSTVGEATLTKHGIDVPEVKPGEEISSRVSKAGSAKAAAEAKVKAGNEAVAAKQKKTWKPPEYATKKDAVKIANKEPLTSSMVRDKDYDKLWNNPNEDTYSKALEKHQKLINDETDPEAMKSNYDNWTHELELARVHGTADDVETAGILRDDAYEKLKTSNRAATAAKPSAVEKPVQKIDNASPGLRAKMFRGAHEPIDILFKDTNSREMFGAGQAMFKGGEIKPGLATRFKEASLRVAKEHGLSEQEARKSIIDYNAEVRKQGSAIDKKGGDLTAPSFGEFLEKRAGEEPLAMKSPSGGIKRGVNIKRAEGEVTTGYSAPLESIMVREGMQNAIDAVKHMGKDGHIKVNVSGKNMKISDNGKGMTREQLETVFSDLHETGKEGEAGASGGKGIGKASYQTGGKSFSMETVAFVHGKKVKLSMKDVTPDMWADDVPIKEEIVPLETPTGTTIETTLKDGQEGYNTRSMMDRIQENSRGIKAKLSVNKYGSSGDINSTGFEHTTFHPGVGDRIIGSQNIEGNNVSLIVAKDAELDSRSSVRINVLNNGMFQYSTNHYLSETTDHMPRDVIVDVHPTAEEGSADYPFPTQRESLKETVNKRIEDMVNEKLAHPEQQTRKMKLKELYESMTEVPGSAGTIRKSVMFDPGGRLTPKEAQTITNSPFIQTYNEIIDNAIGDIMAAGAGHMKWADRLENVGIGMFEEGHKGLHVPNPETGKSTILSNPFDHINDNPGDPAEAAWEMILTAMHETAHVGDETPGASTIRLSKEDMADPRIGKYLLTQMKHVQEQGGGNPGHGFGWSKRLAQIFSEYGPRKAFDAADKLEAALTDESGGYSSEVQKLLQISKKSRGREATTEDLLTPTGEHQADKGRTGKENEPSNNNPNGTGVPTQEAVSNLLQALDEAKGKMSEQEAINRKTRSERFAAFSGVKEEGSAGAAKSLSKLRGAFDKVDPGERLGMTKEDTDSLFTAIKRAAITPAEKARGYTALFKLMNGEGVPVRSELAIMDEVFGNGFADHVVEMHGGVGMVGLHLGKTLNTMKSMQNALSLAAPLRHGIGMVARKEFYPAFADMFRFFAKKEYYNAAMEAIHDDPEYVKSREAGLFISKPGSMMNSEEEFLNSYAGKAPKWTGISQAVAASQRGYVGFLNKLKFDVYKSMTSQAEKLGTKMFDEEQVSEGDANETHYEPTTEARAITRYINTVTGRGNLPGNLNKVTNELNMALWSPRMIASRITMLTSPSLYMGLPKGMRLDGLKALLGIAALGTIVDTLGYFGGAKISTNILSSDFAKNRFGTRVIDPWGGFQQYIVAAARFLAGKTDASQPTNRLEIAGRFMANKESPGASLAHSILTAKKSNANKEDPTTAFDYTDQYNNKTSVGKQVLDRFTPIFIQDLEDLAKSDSEWSEDIGLKAVMVGASLAGMSQNYKPKTIGKLGMRGMNKLTP